MAETPQDRVPRLSAAAGTLTRARPRLFSPIALARSQAFSWALVAIGIVIVAAGLRFHGLGWDQPAGADVPIQLHPDERFISFVANDADWPGWGGYFDTAESPLNPYNTTAGENSFVYGTFPVFAGKWLNSTFGEDADGPGGSYGEDVKWGRRLTALTDTATVALVIMLGLVLFGRMAALLAGAGYALAVFPIQIAHFWTVDPYATFFATAALLCSVLAIGAEKRGRFTLWMMIAGLAVGLGLASKVTAFPIALAPGLAVVVRIAMRDLDLGLRWRGETAPRRKGGEWLTDIAILCLAAWIAIFAFRVAQPYAFVGPNIWDLTLNQQWIDDLQRERELQSPNSDYPPFVQFADGTPLLEPLKNIVLWGLGPGMGLLGIGALVAAAVVTFRRRELAFVLPIALALSVFAFQGLRIVAFMRYFEPIYPVLALLAGWAAVSLWRADWSGAGERAGRLAARVRLPRLRFPAGTWTWAPRVAVVAAFSVTALWAIAFQSVYANENTRIEASEWIYEHVPEGSAITSEIWDDRLPLNLPDQQGAVYVDVPLDPYRTDTVEKVRQFIYGVPGLEVPSGLDGADYIAVSSHRIRDSVVNLEREYPAMIRYYELLEAEELGFERVAEFTSPPSLLGFEIDDSGAEEAFTVYDHPEVAIYEKTDEWDPDAAFALLMEAHPERAVNLNIGQGGTNGLQFTPEDAATQQAGGTFDDLFDRDGLTSHVPWIWWLAFIQLAALASLPWVTWLLRAVPDRGYGLSKIIGLTAVALPVWLAVAWGLADFSATLVWVVWGAVIAVGAALAFARRETLMLMVRTQWKSWLALELIFLLVFGVFLAFRFWNPDAWHPFRGGEKPMELAYLTAVARSTELPPFDPWFGGGSMNYYYMGWFFLAVPMRALRMLPEVAFNIAIPTYAGLAAITVASVAHNLVGLAPRVARAGGLVSAWRRPAIITALVAAVLMVGIGNLDGAHQTIERFQSVNEWGFAEGTPVIGGAVGLVGGIYQWAFEGAALPPFDWWRSSRVHFGQFDITEFPFWTFLFADLHPHLMGMPFFGATIGLGVAYIASATAGFRRQAMVLAVALGLFVGLVRTVHTWDFPTAAIIAGGSIVIGQLLARGRWDIRFWRGAGDGALMGAALILPFLPYTSRFEVFNSGIHRAEETTQGQQFLAHFGLFVFIAAVFIIVRQVEEVRSRAGQRTRNPLLALSSGPIELASLAIFLSGLVLFTWQYDVTVVAVGVVALLFLTNLLWLEWRAKRRDVSRTIATALLALGIGVAVGVDVVTVNDDIVRMNTVFKFSLQAWQLFAIAGAYATWYVSRALWEAEGFSIRVKPRIGALAMATSAAMVLLVAGSALFVLIGTPERQSERYSTSRDGLNGFAYLEDAVYFEDLGTPEPEDNAIINLAEEKGVIDWLRANVEGSPVIAEAVGPLYHWTGRISMHTGLPAVMGWDWHQTQQRFDYGGLVQQRMADTRRFYASNDILDAERYLLTYNVRYVVLGGEERAHGTTEGLAKIERLPSLTEVYRSGDNAIYAVDQQDLFARSLERATP